MATPFALLISISACVVGWSDGESQKLVEIREKGVAGAKIFRSIEYSYFMDSNGRQMGVQFYGDGDNFRVDRVDTTGAVVNGRRSPPLKRSAAFDGKRQQLLIDESSRLQLRDGNQNASYAVSTPHTMIYAWLRSADAKFRWDSIHNATIWRQRFSDAKYVGTITENRLVLEIVEFPQREGVKTPCIFRVYFAPLLGYLPIKYERRVEKSGELASSMRVERYKTMEVEGSHGAVPLEVKFEQNNKDTVSLPMVKIAKVNEESIKINHKIDASLFTIDRKKAKVVLDREEFERERESARQRPLDRELSGSHSSSASVSRWLVGLNLGVGLLVLGYFGARMIRKRNQ
jgi:hypothetical protein